MLKTVRRGGGKGDYTVDFLRKTQSTLLHDASFMSEALPYDSGATLYTLRELNSPPIS